MYKVIIAEDEMLVRIGLKNIIEWEQFEMMVVADVANGQEAWEAYQKHSPEVVITDLKMPIMDGMQLISKIREDDRNVQIIILTCIEDFTLIRQAMALGVNDYILKLTMSPEEMAQVLKRVSKDLNKYPKLKSAYKADYNVGNENIFKERLVKDYLFRNRFTADEFMRHASLQGLRFANGNTFLGILEIDHYEKLEEKFKDESGQLIRMSMLNVIEEILNLYQYGEVIHEHEKRYMLFFSFPEWMDENKMKTELKSAVDHIQQIISLYFNVTVSCAVSSKANHYGEWSRKFREPSMILDYKYALGLNIFYYWEDLKDTDFQKLVWNKLQGFLAEINTLSPKLRKEFESNLTWFSSMDDFTRDKLQKLCIQWLHRHLFFLRLPEQQFSRMTLEFAEAVEICETVEEIVDLYKEAVNVHQIPKQKLHKEVSVAVDYISKHYADNLTLAEVAERVSITPNYLTGLMKRELNMSFVEYLTHYRIEIAQKLLLDTNLLSYEIADKVGFPDHSYFSRTFKKMTGFGPREFRLFVLNDWTEEKDHS